MCANIFCDPYCAIIVVHLTRTHPVGARLESQVECKRNTHVLFGTFIKQISQSENQTLQQRLEHNRVKVLKVISKEVRWSSKIF